MPQIIFVEPDAACRAVPAHPCESRMAAAYAKVTGILFLMTAR